MKPLKNKQLYQLTRAYFLETLREPETLFWGMIFPVLISIGLGLAFTQASESKFNIVIVEKNRTVLDSLLHIHAVPNPGKGEDAVVWKTADNTLGVTEFHFVRSDWPAAIVLLKRGEADMIATDSAGMVRYHFDPHNSQAELGYLKLSALIRQSTAAVSRCNPDPQSPAGDGTASITPLTLTGVRYIDFLVPGLIAFGLMSSILWGISYTLIERRSQKLLRRMVATPMRKSQFLISMMLVRTVMNVVEALVLFAAAWLLFDTVIQGNIGALLLLFLAGNIAFTGVAVLLSCRTSKTEVGTGWINAVQMPMMILSGIFFSYHNFPEWSIPFIKLLPLTALTDGLRSIFNEGTGWLDVIMPSAALSLLGVICFVVGLRRFKWY
jgi:ABC-type multidrug transport system permease subunit